MDTRVTIQRILRSNSISISAIVGACTLPTIISLIESQFIPQNEAGYAFTGALHYPFLFFIKGMEGAILGAVTCFIVVWPNLCGPRVTYGNIIGQSILILLIAVVELQSLIRSVNAIHKPEHPLWPLYISAIESIFPITWILALVLFVAARLSFFLLHKR